MEFPRLTIALHRQRKGEPSPGTIRAYVVQTAADGEVRGQNLIRGKKRATDMELAKTLVQGVLDLDYVREIDWVIEEDAATVDAQGRKSAGRETDDGWNQQQKNLTGKTYMDRMEVDPNEAF